MMSKAIAILLLLTLSLVISADPTSSFDSWASSSSSTGEAGPDQKNLGIGLLAVGVAVLFFGSNFLPVKQHDTGDGMFFQWVLCCGVWLVGLTVNLIRSEPKFEPIAMLGGVLWCTGNLMTVPVVRRIGLAMGIMVWGGTGMVGGWASGVFGFFGIKKQTDAIKSWPLNILGIVIGVASLVISSFIQTTIKGPGASKADKDGGLTVPITADEADGLPRRGSLQNGYKGISSITSDEDAEAALSAPPKNETTSTKAKIEGYLMSIFAGCCYGINFCPPQFLIDNRPMSSKKGIDYVFSHFNGIFLASTMYFAFYCGYCSYRLGRAPAVYPRAILPGIISGVMWAIAQTSWFVANDNLALVLTFPLISLGPGFVAALWGVFLFQEIQGRRNFIILGAVFVSLATACAFIVLSKS